MYLLLLGIIAVGAGLLLVYYNVKDKKPKNVGDENGEVNDKDKGKVIYLFDEEDDGSGFSDPRSDKPKSDKPKPEAKTRPEKPKSEEPEKDDK